MKTNPELTIVSVYHSPESRVLLELNYDAVQALNKKQNWKWVVADNSPKELVPKINAERFTVVGGASVPDFVPQRMRGSYHHALALNNALKEVDSRYLLILDNDFFVLQPEWIERALKHMQERGLAFFGTAYNPKRFGKYRYFPSTHQFCFFDLRHVDLATLDFRPEYLEIQKNRETLDRGIAEPMSTSSLKRELKDFLRLALKRLIGGNRLKIGTSRDTGYGIYRRYVQSDLKRECIPPVFKAELEYAAAPYVYSWVNRVFEAFLPDRLRFFPRDASVYTTKSFKERNYPDALFQGWEEYVWDGKPYAIHLRRNRWGDALHERLTVVRTFLESIIGISLADK